MAFEEFWMSQTDEPTGASLRFSGGQDLVRTPAIASGFNQWTFSSWFKICKIDASESLHLISGNTLSSGAFRNELAVQILNNSVPANAYRLSVFGFNNGSGFYFFRNSQALFRDPSAWYHLVVQFDPDNAISANKIIAYVNGTQVIWGSSADSGPGGTIGSAGYRAINNTFRNDIGGGYQGGGAPVYFSNAYMADTYMVSGSIVAPTTFGQFDANGVWVPYPFATAKQNVITAGGFGTNGFALDYKAANFTSGPNTWADQSGNGNNWTANWDCQVGASATNGTDIMGDGPEINYATLNPLDKNSAQTPKDGNLLFNSPINTGGLDVVAGTIRVTSGKRYWESTIIAVGSIPNTVVGITRIQEVGRSATGNLGSVSGECGYYPSGNKRVDGITTPYGASFTTGDVIGVALDCDAGTVTFYKNNVSQGPISYAVGSGLAPAVALVSNYGASLNINFGQRPFTYTPPAGYSNLYATDLPPAPIPAGSTGFQAILDTGANILTTAQATFPNGLWWVKDRVNANQHQLVDSINTSASTIYSPSNTVGSYTAPFGNSVAWCWATPASGINSSTGFSITTGTHGLGQSPQFVIDRQLNVYHASLVGAVGLKLSTTAAAAAQAWTVNSTTVSGPGGGTYYSWAPITGYSSFGSYTGNGSADGPFAYCGFLPAFVLIKCSSTTGNWQIYDNARNTYNPETLALQPNLTNAESTINGVDFLSNGFKVRTTDANFNTSGQTYVYAAFAENPFGGSNVAPITAR
jgi:hypothetical protein